MLQIGVNRQALAERVTTTWSEINDCFLAVDLDNRETRDHTLDLLRDLIAGTDADHESELLYVVGDSTKRVQIFADFQCDGEGFLTNDGHLCLSVMIGPAPPIMDPGIDDLRELRLPTDTGQVDAAVVFTAAVDRLNELIRRTTAVLTPQTAESFPSRLIDPVIVRGEADDNPDLTGEQRRRLRAASDDDIADAALDCWESVEGDFYSLHDELQSAIVARLTI
ncbi:MAG: hypothetical protein GX542_12300 [Rhodococcus sp.]|nr:hypothetical protein [Rhodococcus sp. (in: high G+C Gram-positive bacteria)]